MGGLIFLVVVVAVLAVLFLQKRHGEDGPYTHGLGDSAKRQTVISRSFMLYGEKNFFRLLCEAFPSHYICPQVSFNALLTHASYIYGDDYVNAVRRKFHHKYVDFVICDGKTLEVLVVVEFDGTGHRSRNDAYRDEMLVRAGYRVERFTQSDTLDSIRERVKDRFGPSTTTLKENHQIVGD